ncbi:S8 family peptidase [Saliterribacillus persicus]|uniref:Subtilase family protein n=1 Tax=Saliterribacillus persicus TaxID=930114 RepID=A0A368X4C5_9BACI|nr:S8 family peptidase [Saliterribacillus persicus]RCW62871.1 subtilase family protein [Saliterribacillus persicus]
MYEHLSLPQYIGGLERRKRKGGGGFSLPEGRIKRNYYQEVNDKAEQITKSFTELKEKYNGKVNPNLVYRISINQSVDYNSFSKTLNSMGGITVLSVAENRKGYWVVFSNDTELESFKDKLSQYSGIKVGNKYDFFNVIDSIEDIPVEDKIGKSLMMNPLKDEEVEYLDIELWRMDNEHIEDFIQEIKNTYNDWNRFRICDSLITNSFALFRVKISNEILKEIIELKEVARVDRPFIPTFKVSDFYGQDVDDFEVSSPDEESVGVLVIDSGITSNHPLLEKAVGDEENFQEVEKELQDKVGHGTAVAGVSLYGDIKQRINEKMFPPSNWLFSGKVMYGQEDIQGNFTPVYDEEKLFENQLDTAIRSFLNNEDYRIKVVNISFGNANEALRAKNNRQFPLAALLDELAYEYREVVFVVSAGNSDPRYIFDELEEIIEHYPNYLVKSEFFRLINPATSALSITVGSIAQEVSISEQSLDGHKSNLLTPIAKYGEASPFTRTGFGINGMIKPEVVHYGGNLILKKNFGRINEDLGGKLPLLSNKPTEKLFNFNYGTSFSAPMITHVLGKIANKYPDKSANFLKNLLLQSTETTKIDGFSGSDREKQNSLLKINGYGLPNYDKAISSFDNRVVLLDEGVISLNKVQVYSFDFPQTFFETKGYKRISVALTFDPITRMTRGDSYLGNRMQFKLYHSINPNIVAEKFAEYDFSDDEAVMEELDSHEIKLTPGPNIRNSGCHQKGVKEYKREPKTMPNAPLTLVIINSNKWIADENHEQNYCVSVLVEHSQDIKVYSEIRTAVQQRVRIK